MSFSALIVSVFGQSGQLLTVHFHLKSLESNNAVAANRSNRSNRSSSIARRKVRFLPGRGALFIRRVVDESVGQERWYR